MMTLGMLVGFTLFSSPTNAQTVSDVDEAVEAVFGGDPWDPHELIADSKKTRIYSRTLPDRLQVWACDTTNGDTDLKVDPARLVEQFEAVALPYFAWLSNNRYRLEFVEGDTVTVADYEECRAAVRKRIDAHNRIEPKDEFTGFIVMTDTERLGPKGDVVTTGKATHGYCNLDGNGNRCISPVNDRYAVLRSNKVSSPNAHNDKIHEKTLVHEMGHMLGFPHSFSGDIPVGKSLREYDNPMDIMSGGLTNSFGTPAINRYAAGWLSHKQVRVHPADFRSGAVYDLVPIGQPGLQMLVLPVRTGAFYTLEARAKSERDSGIPRPGVEVYFIDQFDCEATRKGLYGICTTMGRRTRPVVAAGSSVRDAGHVYDEDSQDIVLDNDAFRVRVLRRIEGDNKPVYKVWIGSGPPKGKFFDDEGSVHEKNIDRLAAAGIAKGCDRDGFQFCPRDKVTRSQMVLFLARALGLTATTGDRVSEAGFSDVNPRAAYAGYLNALVSRSIASGYSDGTFRPNQPITRGETAIMLNRAFALDSNGDRDTVDFTDVPPGTELATATANLYAAKITQGSTRCSGSGRRFCPDDSLTRAQMASLLVRSPIPTDTSDEQEVQTEWHVNDYPIREGNEKYWWPGQPGRGYGDNNYVYTKAAREDLNPDNTALWEMGNRIGRQEIQVYIPGNNATATVDYQIRIHRTDGTIADSIKRTVEQVNEVGWTSLATINPNGREVSILVEDNGARQDWREDNTRNQIWSHIGIDAARMRCISNCTSDTSVGKIQPGGRRVQIWWGADVSDSDLCPQDTVCLNYRYDLKGDFGPAPYTLECWSGGRFLDSTDDWSGPDSPETGCLVWGPGQPVFHVVVDGVPSNELRWPRPG